MIDTRHLHPPNYLDLIETDTEAVAFGMSSDARTGAMLRSLAASKPGGNLLELGTGTGLATAWLLDGMSPDARLTSIDNDEAVQAIARRHLAADPRVEFLTQDAAVFLGKYNGAPFDMIFADTFAGKFTHLPVVLDLLAPGGIYVIDDLLPQPNWPEDHQPSVHKLLQYLENEPDIVLWEMAWSTGVAVAVKRTG